MHRNGNGNFCLREKASQTVWFFLIGIFVFYVLFLQPGNVWTQKKEIKTENGVTVVYNPKTPVTSLGFPSTLPLEEDFVIGKTQEKEDYWFFRLNSLDVDDSGNIYTLDPKAIKIRVFDQTGKLLRTFGNRGQGPGEFQGPAWIKIMPKGVLVVYDILNRRFTYMSLDGETLKTVDTNRLPFGSRIIDANGYIYLYKRGRRAEGREELVKFDPTFSPIITFHSFEKITKPRAMNPFPIVYYFTLSKENNFIWLLSSDYNIHVVDSYGKTLKLIIKDHDPVCEDYKGR